ncbi:chromosomal replication initiator protein DnaA, partial [bacterium LRH843]|nr:chromosomal replication initiator protein DnaA [bacterium LRH843]
KLKDINVINVPDDVVGFLAGKITSNVRELEGALNKVIAHATLMNHDITIETTQKVLSDLLRANERTLTIMDIQRKVADYFDIKIADMS